jgi:hypothetical protein
MSKRLSAGCFEPSRRSITDFRLDDHQSSNGGNPHRLFRCVEMQHPNARSAASDRDSLAHRLPNDDTYSELSVAQHSDSRHPQRE